MSGSASLALEQGILQHTLGIAAMAFPAQMYVALCAASLPPSESVGGVEAFGGSYARVAATFALLASPTNIAANTQSVEFPLATADWGELGYFEIWTAQTGGSRLYWGGLVDPVSGNPTTLDVSAGDIVRFSAGTLAIEVAAPNTVVAPGVSSFNTRVGAVVLSNSDVVAVLPPSANAPLMDGVAAVGTSAMWARGDHVHPSETVSVKAYGATGNGTTDDTAALNAAAAAIPTTGGTLYLPKGRYSVSGTVFIRSLTRLVGDGWGSVIAANSFWLGGTTYQLVMNQNYAATTITDHDIVVEDLAFDYTNMPVGLPPAAAHGGIHAAFFRMARNVQVRGCLFQAGTVGNDATAMVACDTTLVEGCVSYGTINASYDHWWNPQNAKVVNCHARGPGAHILFNPEPDSGTGTGFAAANFVASGNTLVNTSATMTACQFEPLAAGNTLANVLIIGNTFSNIQVVTRGTSNGVTITGNTFVNMANSPAIFLFTGHGGTPDGVVVTNNAIINPASTGGASPITVTIDDAVIVGNRVTGTALGLVPSIDTSSNAAVVIGNSVANGVVNTIYAVSGTGRVTVRNGQGFAWKDASGSLVTWNVATDNHMIWQGTGSTGSQRQIMDIYQRSDTSALTWSVPMRLNGTVGFNNTAPIAKPTVSGAKGSNAALASLLAALAAYGLVTDTTTA